MTSLNWVPLFIAIRVVGQVFTSLLPRLAFSKDKRSSALGIK